MRWEEQEKEGEVLLENMQEKVCKGTGVSVLYVYETDAEGIHW
jgi:hypothetical protein